MEQNSEERNNPEAFRELIRSSRFWKPFAGVVIGGTLGFLYYYFVGCNSGNCAITGNPFSSILMGSAMGFFVVNSPCRSC